MVPAAAIRITEERTFSAKLGGRTITGLAVASAWEGFTKYTTGDGGSLIILDDEQRVITASPELIAQLGLINDPLWVTVPRTTLPGGLVVPSFQVARFLTSRNDDGAVVIDSALPPVASITFNEAMTAARDAGWNLITETQWLAIAWDASQVASNWSGGAVGSGKLNQGIRNDSCARHGDYLPAEQSVDPVRRYLTLSNGERVYDFNGNLFQWVFDDVQGNIEGLIAKTITQDSLSRVVALAAGAADWRRKGLGWQPDGDARWSGIALVRGGCFCSGDNAGVFRLCVGSPDHRHDVVGFRCTK